MLSISYFCYCSNEYYSLLLFFFIFFFFKQKTAYEMRISDWSSDVCSSDLPDGRLLACPGQLERRTAGDQSPAVDHVDQVGEALRLVHVVCGQHDGHSGLTQLLEQLPGGTPCRGVHAGRGLVDEDQLGAADQIGRAHV